MTYELVTSKHRCTLSRLSEQHTWLAINLTSVLYFSHPQGEKPLLSPPGYVPKSFTSNQQRYPIFEALSDGF